EDNLITWTSLGGGAGNNDYQAWNECGQGGRMVWRYNTIDYAGLSNGFDDKWDVHGCQNGNDGTMLVEYYGNVILNTDNHRINFHRGGQGLYFNNVLSGSAVGTMAFDVTNWDTLGWDAQTGLTDCETNRTYIWNITYNGAFIIPDWFVGSGYGAAYPNPE